MIYLDERGKGLYIVKILMKEVNTLLVIDLQENIRQAIVKKSINKMVIDFSDVKFFTSTGFGIFLNINQMLQSPLKLACLNDEITKAIELTKVISVIKIYDSVSDAISNFE
jgi:anti-anti-sigma factor